MFPTKDEVSSIGVWSHGFPTVIIDHDTSVKGLRQLYYRPEFRYSLACHVIHSSLSTVILRVYFAHLPWLFSLELSGNQTRLQPDVFMISP